MKETVFTNNAPKPIGPYSQGIKVGEFLFISGQLGFDKNGELPSNIKLQTENVLTNLQEILKSCDLSLENVVKTTIFFTNQDDFNIINEVYSKYFTKDFPARSAITVVALPKSALIEIEAIAITK